MMAALLSSPSSSQAVLVQQSQSPSPSTSRYSPDQSLSEPFRAITPRGPTETHAQVAVEASPRASSTSTAFETRPTGNELNWTLDNLARHPSATLSSALWTAYLEWYKKPASGSDETSPIKREIVEESPIDDVAVAASTSQALIPTSPHQPSLQSCTPPVSTPRSHPTFQDDFAERSTANEPPTSFPRASGSGHPVKQSAGYADKLMKLAKSAQAKSEKASEPRPAKKLKRKRTNDGVDEEKEAPKGGRKKKKPRQLASKGSPKLKSWTSQIEEIRKERQLSLATSAEVQEIQGPLPPPPQIAMHLSGDQSIVPAPLLVIPPAGCFDHSFDATPLTSTLVTNYAWCDTEDYASSPSTTIPFEQESIPTTTVYVPTQEFGATIPAPRPVSHVGSVAWLDTSSPASDVPSLISSGSSVCLPSPPMDTTPLYPMQPEPLVGTQWTAYPCSMVKAESPSYQQPNVEHEVEVDGGYWLEQGPSLNGTENMGLGFQVQAQYHPSQACMSTYNAPLPPHGVFGGDACV